MSDHKSAQIFVQVALHEKLYQLLFFPIMVDCFMRIARIASLFCISRPVGGRLRKPYRPESGILTYKMDEKELTGLVWMDQLLYYNTSNRT